MNEVIDPVMPIAIPSPLVDSQAVEDAFPVESSYVSFERHQLLCSRSSSSRKRPVDHLLKYSYLSARDTVIANRRLSPDADKEKNATEQVTVLEAPSVLSSAFFSILD